MKHILEQWDLKLMEADITPIQGGVWQIRLGEELYVLKHRSNRTRVLEEYALMSRLIALGQPISQLLYTKKDVPWAEYEGAIYVLYPYVEGMAGDQLDLWNESAAKKMGASLARLHSDLASYEAPESFPSFDLFQEVSSYAWPIVQGYLAKDFRYRLQELEQEISRHLVNPYEALPRQLIHRDFHPGNLIFKEGELAAILDFNLVRLGIRLFDLCYLCTAVLSSSFSDLRKREMWPSFVQAFVFGYSQVQPLTKTEGYSFLYVTYLIQILFIAYFLDAGNSELADLNIALLFWIKDQHEYLEPLIEKAAAN